MTTKLILILITLAFIVIFYYISTLKLLDKILKRRSINKLIRIPVSLLNLVIILSLFYFFSITIPIMFLIITATLIVLVNIFYKDKAINIFVAISFCILYFMALFTLCVGIGAAASDFNVVQIITDAVNLKIIGCSSLILTILCAWFAIKIWPFHQVEIIMKHKEQIWFLAAWVSIFNVYLFCNSLFFKITNDESTLIINYIVAPLAILLSVFVSFLYAIKTSILLGYKKNNEELQKAIFNERQYRESIMNNAIKIYEFNLTKDKPIKGFQEFIGDINDENLSYIDIMYKIVEKKVHTEDIERFKASNNPATIMKYFNEGRREVIQEYRRLDENGNYIWVRYITNFVCNPETGDIHGITYIKDIDIEKKSHLELLFKAERDSLTGLYNKGTTAMMISKYLEENSIGGEGALFILDVDNFKNVNDKLGHNFGDQVLCEMSDKLNKIFRKDDIIGRIGGDEFIAFFKGTLSEIIIEEKAKLICNSFYNTFEVGENESCTISSSIGIALFPKHGKTFEELYNKSDIALYSSKESNKNTFTVFEESLTSLNYQATRTEIENKNKLAPEGVNKTDYIYKILTDGGNPHSAINSVLEIITQTFGFDRGYIFEFSEDGKTLSNTFEWCYEGVEPEIDKLQNVPIEFKSAAIESFYNSGMFVLNAIEDLKDKEREFIEKQEIKSMFQFAMFSENRLIGYIGFDNCCKRKEISLRDISEILNFTYILSNYFLKHRSEENLMTELNAYKKALKEVYNEVFKLDKTIYEAIKFHEEKIDFTRPHP